VIKRKRGIDLMERWLLRAVFVSIVLLGLGVPTAGADFCDGGLVSKGSTKDEVREACGEPACIRRPKEIFVYKAGRYVPLAMDKEWIYNPGSGRFVRFIRFYQGKVVDQRTGDFGWEGERDCKDVPPPR
jgi:hypothetical protein